MGGSKERVVAALEHREPDRVPTFDLMMDSIAYEIIGKRPTPVDRLLTVPRVGKWLDRLVPHVRKSAALSGVLLDKPIEDEAEGFARAGAAAAVELGLDSVGVSYYPVFRLQDSKTIDDIFGRRYVVHVDRRGFLVLPTYTGGLIKSVDDWKALDKRPLLALPAKANEALARIQREYGESVYIFAMCTAGLFENTWEPMGFERFVVASRKEKDFVTRMIRFYTDLFCSSIEAFADAGVPGIYFGDDLAYRSGPMLNPRMLEGLFGDGYRRITETAHSLGMKIIIHSCGNTSSLLGWLADCGFDGVHPLEPTAGMELADAKKAAGDRICLIGNIDVSYILVSASKEEVYETVREAISDAGAGGGFILAADHSHEGVSLERLRWMLEAGRKYGNYPLSV